MVNQRRRHLPVGDHHPQVAAVRAEDGVVKILERLRMKFTKVPVARFAHHLLAAKFVQLQNEGGFFLFRHATSGPPRRKTSADARCRRNRSRSDTPASEFFPSWHS